MKKNKFNEMNKKLEKNHLENKMKKLKNELMMHQMKILMRIELILKKS
jgi:hypothetical protein